MRDVADRAKRAINKLKRVRRSRRIPTGSRQKAMVECLVCGRTEADDTDVTVLIVAVEL